MTESGSTAFTDFEEMLREKGWYMTMVQGRSMFPMLRGGRDTILVGRLEGRLKPYDVAIYRAPGKYIVHRVLEVHPDRYIIRGDNCTQLENVSDARVVGVLKGFWRRDRYIDVTSPGYLRYSRFWVAINPVVRACHLPRQMASGLFHLIFGPDVHPLQKKRTKNV